MQIKNAEDLFRLYDFEGDLRLKIKQYLNADTYLLKMGKMSIVYKNFKDKIKIIEIHIF
ncbi:hypothetical protein [Campylobacter upsaliensis]|uniref:Uncharacterized protein n=1 Tax=Campylobacter upsaliensis TaxID=28080 RepID=A0A381EFM5_CAMUP|nr:hypothetical protein [Campylobacter upsaliensis]SUX25825.1 Uncharacterised protein [Campylobacter upsaliensis]SUX26667.1 Uncharacterised protein [Campylobacter upsaliensis]SUX27068.1 Uncharacterised protein [Campylobacter upsaliensis]